ncbi:MAG: hypothetical protein MHM6MM_005365 [Cercozoa sp. M6MM]
MMEEDFDAAATLGLEYVYPGQVISVSADGDTANILRGHGTRLHNNKLLSTLSGFVHRVDKWVAVRPMRGRYAARRSDIVVGRVVDVADGRWYIDIGGRMRASLQLAAIQLPGGVQRRRTHEDALHMRKFFTEGDVVVAEVQMVYGDGSVALQARSEKFGRAGQGELIEVPQTLVKTAKHHFLELRYPGMQDVEIPLQRELATTLHESQTGVTVILGSNGRIFITQTLTDAEKHRRKRIAFARNPDSDEKFEPAPVSVDVRRRMCRVRNCIVLLARAFVGIFRETIVDVYAKSVDMGLSPAQMLLPEHTAPLLETAMQRCQNLH